MDLNEESDGTITTEFTNKKIYGEERNMGFESLLM